MKKILIIILLMITFPHTMRAQVIITLKECYTNAALINVLAAEKKSYTEISALREDNLSKGWLPTIDANGSFLYNSSVIDMASALSSIPVPGIADAIKPLPHEQYKITLDINQVIYDGGTIKNARAIEKADLLVNEKQTEADIYKLRAQINTWYFNILLLTRQREILQNYNELIGKRIKTMESAAGNGVILRTDVDVLRAEKIKLEQQLAENEIRKASLLKVLAGITGIAIEPSSGLILPVIPDDLTDDLNRPELELFDLRKQQLDAGLDMINSKRMPKAFGFATLGYGNPPGNNFFKDEFAPYYILGAGIKWNVFDWNKAATDKHIIKLQQGIIENRKTDMADNLKRLLEVKKSEINSIKTLLNSDSELVSLRQKITARAESQYENGIITATELLNEINSEKLALINFELHKVSLAMAKVEYLNISGKDIE